MPFSRTSQLTSLFILLFSSTAQGLRETPLGTIDVSADLTAIYDSRVFGVSDLSLQSAIENPVPGISADELESSDDFIIKFSPAVHLSRKVNLIALSGSAGVEIAQYLKNKDKSYVIPITTFNIDFDDTLSKQKRVSNNAKIRFDAVFDLGQKVGASVLDEDLVSYTYFVAGFNLRYNHSEKFGVGTGTNYNLRKYQSGSTATRVHQDYSTLPISTQAFYIFSDKLDFYVDYTFSRSKSKDTDINLIDSKSHNFSIGANGDLSQKLDGKLGVGYSVVDFDNDLNPSDKSLSSDISLFWKHNSKTSSNYLLSRGFSPSSQGYSSLSTRFSTGLNHRFLEDLRGVINVNYTIMDYTYPRQDPQKARESSSTSLIGFGASISKTFNEVFSSTFSYDFSYTDRDQDDFARHLFSGSIRGAF